MVAVPLDDLASVIESVSPVWAGKSFERTLNSAAAASSMMVNDSPTTVGGGTAGETVTVTVAVDVPPLPSVIV